MKLYNAIKRIYKILRSQRIRKIAEEDLKDEFTVGDKYYYKKDVIIYPQKKAIAQLVVLPVPKMQTKEISYEELKEIPSLRGDGKYGSSKK